MKNLLILILLLMGTTVLASPQLPSSVKLADKWIAEFRNPFALKIEQLNNSYIANYRGKSNSREVVYTADKGMKCSHTWVKKGDPVAKILLHFHKEGETRLEEVARYYDCWGGETLSEEIVTEGTNLKALPFKDFVVGKRSFTLSETETSKTYRLSDQAGTEFFSMRIHRDGKKQIKTMFKVGGQNFFHISETREETRTRVVYTFFPTDYRYKRNWYGFHFKSWLDQPRVLAAYAYAPPREPIIFLGNENQRVSEQVYEFSLNALLRDMHGRPQNLAMLTEMMKIQQSFFPDTDVQQGGGQNDRILKELRYLRVNILQSKDLPKTADIIQTFINDIEEGTLIINDNRPEK